MARSTAVLVALWIVSVAAMVARLILGEAASGVLVAVVVIAVLGFIATLVWLLARSAPHAVDLPALPPLVLPGLSFGAMLAIIVAALVVLFGLGTAVSPVFVLVITSSLLALIMVVSWRSRLTSRLMWVAVGAGLIAALSNVIEAAPEGNWFSPALVLITVPIMFMAGALLVEHTGFGCIRLVGGRYGLAVKGVLWACVMAVPPALLNIVGGANPADRGMITHWWDVLLAFQPGIFEETWARLFLTTLVYALLRPLSNERPTRALVAAVLVGALTHSAVHYPIVMLLGPNLLIVIFTALAYGVPMALLFAKRDLEHAVGYHFFIDFVRFVAALFSA